MTRTVTILAAIALIVAGVALVHPPSALIVAGLLILLTDYAGQEEPPP